VWTLTQPYAHSRDVFHCPDETRLSSPRGYEYRVGPWTAPPVPQIYPPHDDSGMVMVYCSQHVEHSGDDWVTDASGYMIGPLLVAREDGSVSVIPANQVTEWVYQAGQWSSVGSGSMYICPAGAVCTDRFPGEQWPPQTLE
jgi:hypothetical protein